MASSKRWTMARAAALAVTLLGAQGCVGSADTSVGERHDSTSARVTLVGGTPAADRLRAYWRFIEDGPACVVRAETAASAQDAPCVDLPGAAPPPPERDTPRPDGPSLTDPQGPLGGGPAAYTLTTPGTGGARPLRLTVEDSADLSSIGIGTGGR